MLTRMPTQCQQRAQAAPAARVKRHGAPGTGPSGVQGSARAHGGAAGERTACPSIRDRRRPRCCRVTPASSSQGRRCPRRAVGLRTRGIDRTCVGGGHLVSARPRACVCGVCVYVACGVTPWLSPCGSGMPTTSGGSRRLPDEPARACNGRHAARRHVGPTHAMHTPSTARSERPCLVGVRGTVGRRLGEGSGAGAPLAWFLPPLPRPPRDCRFEVPPSFIAPGGAALAKCCGMPSGEGGAPPICCCPVGCCATRPPICCCCWLIGGGKGGCAPPTTPGGGMPGGGGITGEPIWPATLSWWW